MLGFLEFSALFVGLNIVSDIVHLKLRSIHGIDFLFFAPWLAASLYGMYEGIILALILVVVHALFNLHLAVYELASFPAQLVAVFLGNTMGLVSFWISLIAFLAVSSVIVILLRGFGGRFFIFLLIALVFNYILIFTIPYLT